VRTCWYTRFPTLPPLTSESLRIDFLLDSGSVECFGGHPSHSRSRDKRMSKKEGSKCGGIAGGLGPSGIREREHPREGNSGHACKPELSNVSWFRTTQRETKLTPRPASTALSSASVESRFIMHCKGHSSESGTCLWSIQGGPSANSQCCVRAQQQAVVRP
jgi:hypothetical protein